MFNGIPPELANPQNIDESTFDPTNVFIQNLPKHMNENALGEICNRFGNVESVKIMVCSPFPLYVISLSL